VCVCVFVCVCVCHTVVSFQTLDVSTQPEAHFFEFVRDMLSNKPTR